MKKSTLFASIAVIGTFLTLTAANLKLKKEYTAGHIHDPYIKTKLPAFRFIKEALDKDTNYGGGVFEVSDSEGQEASVAVYFLETGVFTFHVDNDTLFIQSNHASIVNHGMLLPIHIHAGGLKNITASYAVFSIREEKKDSLSVTAGGRSQVNIYAKNLNKICIQGSATANIVLYAKGYINYASVQMNDTSRFHANDIIIKQKSIQLSPQSSLQLSGRSVEDFGVKRN